MELNQGRVLSEKTGLAICDMAGTAVREAGQVPKAFASALAAHGIEVTPPTIKSLRGASNLLASQCRDGKRGGSP